MCQILGFLSLIHLPEGPVLLSVVGSSLWLRTKGCEPLSYFPCSGSSQLKQLPLLLLVVRGCCGRLAGRLHSGKCLCPWWHEFSHPVPLILPAELRAPCYSPISLSSEPPAVPAAWRCLAPARSQEVACVWPARGTGWAPCPLPAAGPVNKALVGRSYLMLEVAARLLGPLQRGERNRWSCLPSQISNLMRNQALRLTASNYLYHIYTHAEWFFTVLFLEN